jgi:hypothetical protein
MPREGLLRKYEKPGGAAMRDLCLIALDESTTAMQNPEKHSILDASPCRVGLYFRWNLIPLHSPQFFLAINL